jgi:hypothetical protein
MRHARGMMISLRDKLHHSSGCISIQLFHLDNPLEEVKVETLLEACFSCFCGKERRATNRNAVTNQGRQNHLGIERIAYTMREGISSRKPSTVQKPIPFVASYRKSIRIVH